MFIQFLSVALGKVMTLMDKKQIVHDYSYAEIQGNSINLVLLDNPSSILRLKRESEGSL